MKSVIATLGPMLLVLSGASAGSAPGNRVELEAPRSHGGFFAFAFSPDGKVVAGGTGIVTNSGGIDPRVRGGEVVLWDAHTGKLRKTLGGHGATVGWLAVSADGKTLASGSRNNGVVKVWNLPSGRLRHTFSVGPKLGASAGGFHTLATLSRDGQTLLAVGGKPVRVGKHTMDDVGNLVAWDAVSGKMLWSLPASGVRAMAVSPDGATLAAATSKMTWSVAPDGSAQGAYSVQQFRLWNTRTGKPRAAWAGGTLIPHAATFGNDGRTLALFNQSDLVWLDVTTRKSRPGFAFDRDHWAYSSAVLSSDGTRLARGWSDYVEILDARSGKRHGRIEFQFPEMLFHPAFTPDLKRMACTLRKPMVVDLSSLR